MRKQRATLTRYMATEKVKSPGPRSAMKAVEKYGADWYWSKEKGELVFEIYDDELDLIGAVHEKAVGHFVASLYEKVKDPGLVTPAWADVRPEALFDDLDAAKAHVKTLIANRKAQK